MEIESFGRSINMSRELIVKKSRIGEDVERERDHHWFQCVMDPERSLERQPQWASSLLERFREIEREREGDRRSRGSVDHDDDKVDRDIKRERDDSSSRGGGQ